MIAVVACPRVTDAVATTQARSCLLRTVLQQVEWLTGDCQRRAARLIDVRLDEQPNRACAGALAALDDGDPRHRTCRGPRTAWIGRDRDLNVVGTAPRVEVLRLDGGRACP